MKMLLINDTEETLPEAFLTEWVGKVSRELDKRKILPAEKMGKELSLVFLKELDAKQLNWNFRQRDYATDVLSFETDDPDSFGELVMCPVVLQKQAKEHKLSYEEELGYMILQGVLHLLGYDHEKSSEEDARVMMNLQDQIFHELRAPKKKAVVKTVKAAKPAKAATAVPKTKPVVQKAAAPAKKTKTAATSKKSAAPSKKTAVKKTKKK